MQIGIYMPTHGVGLRDEEAWFWQDVPAREMRPVEVAQQAERLGYHSLWFGDHVTMPKTTVGAHPTNPDATARRAYPIDVNILDGLVVMGAVAAKTSRIRMSPGVIIAPYRHPLHDARQFASVDVLSNGRLMVGVGPGWNAEEFAALGVPFKERVPMMMECIEVYKAAWSQHDVEFHGEYYDFEMLSMEPKPVRQPRPPLLMGALSPAGGCRAVQSCDGLYTAIQAPYDDVRMFDATQDAVRVEAERLGRDLSTFYMWTLTSAYLTEADHLLSKKEVRPQCTGTKEQVLSDLAGFAEAGYSLVNLIFDAPSGTVKELQEQIEWFGTEVLPHCGEIQAAGEWNQEAP